MRKSEVSEGRGRRSWRGEGRASVDSRCWRWPGVLLPLIPMLLSSDGTPTSRPSMHLPELLASTWPLHHHGDRHAHPLCKSRQDEHVLREEDSKSAKPRPARELSSGIYHDSSRLESSNASRQGFAVNRGRPRRSVVCSTEHESQADVSDPLRLVVVAW